MPSPSSPPPLPPPSSSSSSSCSVCDDVRVAFAALVGLAVLRSLRHSRIEPVGRGPERVSAIGATAAALTVAPIAALATAKGVLAGVLGGLVTGALGGALAGGAAALDARNATAAALSGKRAMGPSVEGAGGAAAAVTAAPAPSSPAAPSTAIVPVVSPPAMGGAGGGGGPGGASATVVTPGPTTPSPTVTPSGGSGGAWPPADVELTRIMACACGWDAQPAPARRSHHRTMAARVLPHVRAGKNAYEVLCVPSTASAVEIRASHRARSRAYHPDRCRHESAHAVSTALNNATSAWPTCGPKRLTGAWPTVPTSHHNPAPLHSPQAATTMHRHAHHHMTRRFPQRYQATGCGHNATRWTPVGAGHLTDAHHRYHHHQAPDQGLEASERSHCRCHCR